MADPHATGATTETPVVFLMGPTASGKTDLAVALAERAPVSIISVDSAMVYRGMDIGTGKPDAATRARAPHALVDIREPHETYSAADFRDDALACIRESRAAGRLPLLVGGTGLYFRALRQGLSPLPRADARVREALAAEAETIGWTAMHERLAAIDPEAAARIHSTDPQRIQRALEVHAVTGQPLSRLQRRGAAGACPWPVFALSLEPADRTWLHRRIAARFRLMLSRGLEAEVAALRARAGYSPQLPSMRSVGYRQMIDHLDGAVSWDAMEERAVVATRQLARRQLTWLRREAVDVRVAADAPAPLSRVVSALSRWLC